MRLVQLALSTLAALALSAAPAPAGEPSPLSPFVISYDAPDNATSMAHLLDAPAGKHGFLRSENGRLVNAAGPVRLHATNLTGPANFPSHQDADRLAARLARFGINCVRLHYMDAKYKNFIQAEQPASSPTTPPRSATSISSRSIGWTTSSRPSKSAASTSTSICTSRAPGTSATGSRSRPASPAWTRASITSSRA